MKRLLLLTVILLFLGLLLAGWMYSNSGKDITKNDLPWKIELSETGATKVLGLDIGRLTLEEMMLSLHKIAELSVFESREGELSLEAFFGKTRLGIFDATLVAELDADQLELKQFINLASPNKRKGTPSGNWKYEITEESVKKANDMRVWRLVYMPSVNYDATTIQKYFGEPDSKEQLEEGLTYWFYPKKGVVVLEDDNGREVFYYVAADEFSRLEAVLPKEKPEIK